MYPKSLLAQPSRQSLGSALVSLGIFTIAPAVRAICSFLISRRDTIIRSAVSSIDTVGMRSHYQCMGAWKNRLITQLGSWHSGRKIHTGAIR
jgi:hypothetical protein